jgi:predicted amidohydrolase
MLRVDGAGISVAYDKMWLGGPEAEHFSPGRRPAVIDVDGCRLGLAICKDTGVSTHASVVASRGIDVYVAGVCETEDDRDVQPQRARRVIADLGVWVAVAGFAGPTGGGFDSTAGRSSIWRPDGRLAASLDSRPGQVARATFDGPSVVDR